MTRTHHGVSADLEWINVSVWRRCPICGGAAGCKTHAEGTFAACGKQPSDWPMTSGAWLHRVEPPFSRGPHSGAAVALNDGLAAHASSPSAAGTVA